VILSPSVLWHCWFGDRKNIRPVKSWALVVMIWLLLARLIDSRPPLSSCLKVQNGDILVPAYPDCPGDLPLNECRRRPHASNNSFQPAVAKQVAYRTQAIRAVSRGKFRRGSAKRGAKGIENEIPNAQRVSPPQPTKWSGETSPSWVGAEPRLQTPWQICWNTV